MTDGDTEKRLTIVIPAYNEAGAIKSVIDNIRAGCARVVREIIVVDDGSSDGTAKIAEEAGARVVIHRENKGYGAALKSGIRAAQTEFIMTLDADGQHHPEDVMRLWEKADEADMVVGARSRFFHSSLWRMPGKWFLNWMANYLTKRKIPDLNSGLRLIRREVAMRYLYLCPSGFSFSTTITMTLLCRGYVVSYVPINVEKRIGKSTVSLSTGMDTVFLILRVATLFNPFRIFVPLSFLLALLGIAWGIPYLLMARGIATGALLALVTSVIIFSIGLVCDQISQLRLERYE